MSDRRPGSGQDGSEPFAGLITGIHDLRIPVTDPWASVDWYTSVLAFQPLLDLEEESGLVGVVLRHPSGVVVGLHQDAARSRAMRGFVMCVLTVEDRGALRTSADALSGMGEVPGPIRQGHLGWYLDLPDPDGIVVRLHTATTVDAEEA